MPTYADRDDCLELIEGLTIEVGANAAFDRLIERAELELDTAISWTTPSEDTTGTKLSVTDVAGLSARRRDNLRRATCAQVEYMIQTGEAHLIVPQLPSSGPDFSVEGQLPRIGPRAMEYLRRGFFGTAWAPVSGGRLPSRKRRGILRPTVPAWWKF